PPVAISRQRKSSGGWTPLMSWTRRPPNCAASSPRATPNIPTPDTLAYSAGVPARICEVLVSDLQEAGLIQQDEEGGINIVVSPQDFKDGVRDLVAKLKTFRYEGERRLRLLPDYAQSMECRSVFLRRYFGEDHPPRCGTCDRCRADSVAATPANPMRKARD